ncbi:MAG: hypothetical protein RL701_6231, partial [Pseudomonadota bacterium]
MTTLPKTLVYYALGGGLGHLVRARAFLHTLGLRDRALVLTASPHALDARVMEGLAISLVPEHLERDQQALQSFLADEISRVAADCLCVDTFPAGLLGELEGITSPPHVQRWHVARLLRWNVY